MQRIVTTHVGVTNRGLQDVKEEIAGQAQSLKKLGDEFSNWAKETANKLDDRLNEVEKIAKELEDMIQQQVNRIDKDVIRRIEVLESQWKMLSQTLMNADCKQGIDVLTQVRDMVTDKEFKLADTNPNLDKISAQYKEYVEKIADDQLKMNFKNVFEPFNAGDENERRQRLHLIVEVHRDLLRYFAPRVAV